MVASTIPVEEVLGSRPGRVLLKKLKIVPTASLFGTKLIRDSVGGIFLPETDVLCRGNNVPSWLNVNKYGGKHCLYGPPSLLAALFFNKV